MNRYLVLTLLEKLENSSSSLSSEQKYHLTKTIKESAASSLSPQRSKLPPYFSSFPFRISGSKPS